MSFKVLRDVPKIIISDDLANEMNDYQKGKGTKTKKGRFLSY